MDVARVQVKKRPYWLLAVPALGLVTLLTASLKAAVPTVERATVWTAKVQHGQMVREARGAGTLVPEEIRWITTVVPARVDKIALRPGAAVETSSVIMSLTNPDIALVALEAEQQLASAKAELVRLEAEQNSQALAQQSTLASLEADQRNATRRATADKDLADKGYLSSLELEQSQGKASELVSRIRFENERLQALTKGRGAQLQAQRAQVQRLQAIAELRRQQVSELQVRASVQGVVQEVGVQVGQWVTPGTVLAKVAQPSKIKAEVRIPELSARELAIGQTARVDTRNGIVSARVSRVDPAVTAGIVKVDLMFDEPLPAGARVDQNIEGIVELEKLSDVTFVDRPANAQASMQLFVVRGTDAVKTAVRFGRASVKTIEVTDGLVAGDEVILSDMSSWTQHDQLRMR